MAAQSASISFLPPLLFLLPPSPSFSFFFLLRLSLQVLAQARAILCKYRRPYFAALFRAPCR